MRKALLIITFSLLLWGSAQNIDSNYIKPYCHKIIINPWIGLPQNGLLVVAKSDTGDFHQEYVSNTRMMMGLDFTFRDLSLSLGFRTPIYSNDTRFYGKSKTGTISLRYAYRKWAFEGKHGSYLGFADATNIDSTYKALPFRKDLHTTIQSITSIYTFKPNKFSYGAAFNYAYRQMRSAWSTFILGHLYRANFEAHSNLLDTTLTDLIHKTKPFNRTRTNALGIGPGICGTLVIYKRFFLTGMLSVGADFQMTKLTLKKQNVKTSSTVNPFADFRFAMGYNTNRVFTAFTLKSQNLVFEMDKFAINHTYTLLTFEIGYRFDTPKWIHQSYDNIMRKRNNKRV